MFYVFQGWRGLAQTQRPECVWTHRCLIRGGGVLSVTGSQLGLRLGEVGAVLGGRGVWQAVFRLFVGGGRVSGGLRGGQSLPLVVELLQRGQTWGRLWCSGRFQGWGAVSPLEEPESLPGWTGGAASGRFRWSGGIHRCPIRAVAVLTLDAERGFVLTWTCSCWFLDRLLHAGTACWSGAAEEPAGEDEELEGDLQSGERTWKFSSAVMEKKSLSVEKRWALLLLLRQISSH